LGRLRSKGSSKIVLEMLCKADRKIKNKGMTAMWENKGKALYPVFRKQK
jgi:hypothetical protein